MNHPKWLVVFFLLLAFTMPVFALVPDQSLKIFAISDGGGAITANLDIRIVPGTGKVWTTVEPLVGTGTQESAKTALKAAEKYFPNANQYDYFFDINSDASVVDGPSAGSAMGLLIVSSLQNKRLPLNIGLTGTLTEDKQIGPVGGVFEKAKEAARIGLKLFMIPKGEARQVVRLPEGVQSINLVEYGQKEWGLKVVEVENLDQALQLAFTDVNSIVPEQVNPTEPEFYPPAIALPDSLSPMSDFTKSFINRVEVDSDKSRKDLGKSTVENPALVDAMLVSLNSADRLLEDAHAQIDRNYVFTAANSVFLAQVDILMVQELLQNQDMGTWGSKIFDQKLDLLEIEIGRQKSVLDGPLPPGSFEWFVAAQQRLSWSEEHLHTIRETLKTKAGQGNISDQIDVLSDYEYALAWLRASKDFVEIAQKTRDSNSGVLVNTSFDAIAGDYISRAQKAVLEVNEDEKTAVKEKLDAALIARDSKMPLASAFNAGFALALADAAHAKQTQDVNELKLTLSRVLSDAREKIHNAPFDLIWGQMYADHADYYLQVGDDQWSKGKTDAAAESYQSALILANLSLNLSTIAIDAHDTLRGLPADQPITVIPANSNPILPATVDPLFWAAVVLFIISLAALVFALMAFVTRGQTTEHYPFDKKLEYYTKLQADLSKSLASNHLTKMEYMDLYTQYESKKQLLIAEKNRVSKMVIILESVSSQVKALENNLRALKREYANGSIGGEDFEKAVYRQLSDLDERLKTVALPAPAEGGIKISMETAQPVATSESPVVLDKPVIVNKTIINKENKEKSGGEPEASKRRLARKSVSTPKKSE